MAPKPNCSQTTDRGAKNANSLHPPNGGYPWPPSLKNVPSIYRCPAHRTPWRSARPYLSNQTTSYVAVFTIISKQSPSSPSSFFHGEVSYLVNPYVQLWFAPCLPQRGSARGFYKVLRETRVWTRRGPQEPVPILIPYFVAQVKAGYKLQHVHTLSLPGIERVYPASIWA